MTAVATWNLMNTLAVAACVLVAGCAPSGSAPAGERAAAPETTGHTKANRPSSRSGLPLITDEAWVYDGRAGRAITTPHYRVFLTQTEPAFLGRLPVFLEAALQHYRVVATGAAAPLPADIDGDRRLNTMVFRTRAEWERWTRQTLGDAAGPFLSIRRGGYAWAGTAVLFDIGAADTMAIAAHEGWHQFTQRTFTQPLPAWLEESIATLCEGQRWIGGGGELVRFDPADNPIRREQLTRIVASGRLRSVERLVLEVPANLAAEQSDAAVDYYAQVWALGLLLREQTALSACVHDAASGRLGEKIVAVLGRPRAAALVDRARGLAVLEAYFVPEAGGLDQLESAYRRFVGQLVSPAPNRDAGKNAR